MKCSRRSSATWFPRKHKHKSGCPTLATSLLLSLGWDRAICFESTRLQPCRIPHHNPSETPNADRKVRVRFERYLPKRESRRFLHSTRLNMYFIPSGEQSIVVLMQNQKALSVLSRKFQNEEVARAYLERRLWHSGVRCPFCLSKRRITVRKNGFHRCNACKRDFTVRTGTVMERSHVPLNKWVYAMYLLAKSKNGLSSTRLAAELGITQKSAWSVLHRLNDASGKPHKAKSRWIGRSRSHE